MNQMRWSHKSAGLIGGMIWLVSLGASAFADVKLPNVIGKQMVLQRDQPIPLWGWADPGEKVTVSLGEQSETATTGDDGKWKVVLKPMKAGGPWELTIAGNNELVLDDILIGEVWVCSGQSNMQWSVSSADRPMNEIMSANHPRIRLFLVPRTKAAKPLDDVNASWKACSPASIPDFSAVAYFFGRALHQELDVPIGLIATAWDGTRIEPWTPPVGFHSVEKLADLAAQVDAQEVGENPSPQTPTVLYNGMVHGIVPFGMRGAIWYQGESNRGEGMLYHEKMKALLAGWRKTWSQGDFPFYFVQLAPFKYNGSETMLPEIWEAQTATLAVPNTGMAVTTDIGNVKDIHPKNKQEVGRRLALWALAKDYGQKDIVYSGPLYQSMKVEGKSVRLTFDHVGVGLVSRDGKPLDWFTIAGADGKFVEAQAEIDGDSVVVTSEDVAEPAAVRFGWHQEAEPNLMNKAGLPASPFRTDK